MELREQILRASVQMIEEGGVAALSMREVARRAGVSHQAPYHYFADRAAILAAIAGDGFRRLTEALEKARDEKTPLIASGRAYVRFAMENPAHFRLMFRPDLVDLSAYPQEATSADRAYAALQTLVEQSVDPDLAEGTVTLSWALVHGLATLLLDGPLARADGKEAIIDDAFAAYQRLLTGKKQRKQT